MEVGEAARVDGLADGAAAGELEGVDIGRRAAVDFFNQVEYYRGAAAAWSSVAKQLPVKAQRALGALIALLDEVPLDHVRDPTEIGRDSVDFNGYLERLKTKSHMIAIALSQQPISLEASAGDPKRETVSF